MSTPTSTYEQPTPTPSASPSQSPGVTHTPTSPAATATFTLLTRTTSASSTKTSWDVRTLLVGPGQPGRLYALVENRYDPATPPQMRFVTSDNDGTTWTTFPGSLPAGLGCVHNISLVYATADALYASTCKGIYQWSANQWKSISSLETWVIAVVYKKPNTIWAVANNERSGPILRSDNDGATWNPASNDLVHFSGISNLAIDPRDANTLYAIINPKYAGNYLRRGNTNGPWKTLPTPLNNGVIDTGRTIDGTTGTLYMTTANYQPGTNSRWQLWRTQNPNVNDVNAVA